ncbi:MAG TPA: hypothetical protein VNR37_11585 [Microbacteriaceae bacterium]|nr:hypothetical protein [Microbacteriaceae bacterium]
MLVRCRDLGFARPAQQVEVPGINGRSYRVGWEDAWHGRGLEQQLIALGAPRPRRRAASLTF